jgi:hypothetical protein
MRRRHYPKDVTVCLLALAAALYLLGCTPFMPRSCRASRGRVEVLYYWGVGGRNRLDTLVGVVTKDLVSDGQMSTRLVLEPSELDYILALADSLGFFQLPAVIAPPATVDGHAAMQTPCDSYLLRIGDDVYRGHQAHTVMWNTCNANPSSQRDRAMRLGAAIERLVYRTKAWKSLPNPRGGYL